MKVSPRSTRRCGAPRILLDGNRIAGSTATAAAGSTCRTINDATILALTAMRYPLTAPRRVEFLRIEIKFLRQLNYNPQDVFQISRPEFLAVGLRMLLIKSSAASIDDWDEFAQRVGASFRCAYRAARAWQIEHHLLYQLYRLEIFDLEEDQEQKIAQCAIGIGRQWRVFADSLQLDSRYNDRWSEVMTAVVQHCGPGRYVYGSDWSLETSREAAVIGIENVSVIDIYRTNLQVVNFRDWSSWDVYYGSISSNVRRNVAKFKKSASSSLTFSGMRPGIALRLQAIRYETYHRKSMLKGFGSRFIRSILRSAVLSGFYEYGVVRSNKTTLAAYAGVRFGLNTFFLEGGSAVNNKGASWYLLTCVIERAWRDSGGRGAFVLGSDDGSQVGSKAWDGLARSRTACRAKAIPISIIRFSYGSN